MAIELIAKIKQKNNGIFKLVDACDVEMKDGQDLQTCIDNLVVGEGLICVHNEEPTEEQIEKYQKMFLYPEIFIRTEHGIIIIENTIL